jgi:hypothetical protein
MNSQTEIRKRYTEKRLQKAKDYLGGVCIVCGTKDQLEFDHIDPNTKVIEITTAIMAKCWSWSRLVDELNKCQLLCKTHHLHKTIASYPKQPCGTYWKYRKYKCRCERCVAANSEKLAEWTEKQKSRPL